MSVGIFTDKTQPPTSQQILTAVGARRAAWEKLIQFIRDRYAAQEDWSFYGRNYGWALRFRKSGKALISLYPAQNGFAVQVVLGEPEVQTALGMKIGQHIRSIVEAATPFAEGRWLFIPVKSAQDIRDVQQLLTLKSPPRLPPKSATTRKK
jgi:hypothetical protein